MNTTSGDMPRGMQFGYLFTGTIADAVRTGKDEIIGRTVAHELGHGMFRLKHTFDSEYRIAQESTENLMDYSWGTDMVKHQWDAIHEPGLVIGMFDRDEDGMMISTKDKDSIGIKIENANFDFTPGTGNMKIDYSLGKQTMDVLKKYPNEEKELRIAIADKNGKFVHIESKEPLEKDIYTWNGINTDGDTIKVANEPYKIAITLVIGSEKGWFNNWQAFKDNLYESFKSDSIQQIATSVDTSFVINPRRMEWEKYKDMQGFVNKSYDNYVKLYDLYMSYDGVKETGNPFEYIKQNTESFSFLGKSMIVHKEFAIVLGKVENTLKQKNVYETIKAKYQNNVHSLTMRTINDPKGGGTVSEHGFGLAIDMGVSKNPQIIGSQKPLVRFFIKQATGFDLGAKKTSYTEVKNAHNKFISLYSNTTNEELRNKYSKIQKYHNNAETIKLDRLQNFDIQVKTLQKRYDTAINDSIGYIAIDSIKNEMSLIINRIDSLSAVLDCYINTIIFTDISRNALIDLKSRIQLLNGSLNLLISENEEEADLNQLHSKNINIVTKEINDFITGVQQINKSYQNLETFGNKLKNEIETIGYNNILLQDGFCDIELEIIEAFLESDSRIQWGGIFTKKIDAMHFGFTTNAAKDVINNKE